MQYRTTKDGLIVHIANTKNEYQEDAKKYVINMTSNKRKLHIKNMCHSSKCLCEYLSYETEDEVKNIPFTINKCEWCFPR